MKKSLRNKIITILGLNVLAIIAAAQAEVMAQGVVPECPQNITATCSTSTRTYSSFPYVLLTANVTGMITNNGTLTSSLPNSSIYVFGVYNAANVFNFINNGTIISSGQDAAIYTYHSNLFTSIINNGSMYTSYSSLDTFTPSVAPGYFTSAIFSTARNFMLDNKENANIIGAAGGVSLVLANGGKFTITNAGRIENTSNVTSSSSNSGLYISNNNTLESSIDSTSSIVNEATGVIKGKRNGLRISSSGGTSNSGFNGFSITNRGRIEGVNEAGIQLGALVGAATINNYGTISGGTSAINLVNGNKIFNIYAGAVFINGINFNNTTGNTLNFHTGSYTLGVKQYNVASNNINPLVAGTQAITSGLDGAGTGDIVIVAAEVAATPAATTTTVASSVSNVVSAVSNLAASITATLPISLTPEKPAPGREAGGFGQDFTAYDPVSPNPVGTRTNIQTYSMANLSEFSATDVLRGKEGQKVDAKGNLAWARAFGSYRSLPSTARVVGNSTAMGGAMFGVDRNLDNWRLGIYGGYSYGHTRMNDASGAVTTDYYMGGVYARRDFGAYTLLANLSGGVMANRMSRSINLGAEQAKSSFNGFFFAPELALSRDVAVAPGWVLTPTLRVRYVGSFLPNYRESGSSQNIAYGSSAAHGLEERAELKLTRNMKADTGLTSSYYVQAAVIGTHRVGGDSLNASLLGTTFTVSNPHKRHTAGAMIGVGFDHQLTRKTSAFGGVDASYYTDKTVSVIGRAGVKMTF